MNATLLTDWTRKLSRRQGRVVFWTLWAVTACLVVLWFCWSAGYRINPTRSLPRGIYRISGPAVSRGDLAAFCLEGGAYVALAREREYLSGGSCPSGLRPLIKEVAALPGDEVRVTHEGIHINGALYPDSALKDADSRSRPLCSALGGGTVPAGKALLLSGKHPGSFDSRYFGYVSLTALERVEALLTF